MKPQIANAEVPADVEPETPAWADLTVRIVGGVLSVLAALLAAAFAAFLIPLRVGTWLIPVSLVITIVANVAVMWFARHATGSKFGVIPPAIAWLIVMVSFATARAEGDVVVPGNNWVSMAVLFVGSTALAGGAVAVTMSRR